MGYNKFVDKYKAITQTNRNGFLILLYRCVRISHNIQVHD